MASDTLKNDKNGPNVGVRKRNQGKSREIKGMEESIVKRLMQRGKINWHSFQLAMDCRGLEETQQIAIRVGQRWSHCGLL